MPLTWDITKCAEVKRLVRSKRERVITDALVWYAMFTDIGWRITEANAPEFYARIRFLERLGDPLVSVPARTPSGRLAKKHAHPYTVPYYITPEDVARRVGMSINVSPEAQRKWAGRKAKRFLAEFAAEYERALEPKEEEEAA
jgi:hypothetical protein